MTEANNTLNIKYESKTLCSFPYKENISIKEIKHSLSQKFKLNLEDIILTKNEQQLEDKEKIDKNSLNNIKLKNIISNFKFYQMGNENNVFDFDFDIINTSISDFQSRVSNFFKEKMGEFNFNISKFEFFNNNQPFFDMNKTFLSHFDKQYKEPKFYFLLQDCAIHFNSNSNYDPFSCEEQRDSEKTKERVELRKNVENGKYFKIIIQTYNHLIKEIEVYPEMTIEELKDDIEKIFMVSKEHQELLYLVYKLDDNNKKIKDYYIRPQGIVFLRGYYFPLVFVDYFDKKNKNIISINIAEQVKYIRQKIINKLNLDNNYNYKLLLNGKTLRDENYLIDFNVQRMQMIYFK